MIKLTRTTCALIAALLVTTTSANATSASPSGVIHDQIIQQPFGNPDISGIQAHAGSNATSASNTLGAGAFTGGNNPALGNSPALDTAAHEAAQVVQQSSSTGNPALDQAINNTDRNLTNGVTPVMQNTLNQAGSMMQQNQNYYNDQVNNHNNGTRNSGGGGGGGGRGGAGFAGAEQSGSGAGYQGVQIQPTGQTGVGGAANVGRGNSAANTDMGSSVGLGARTRINNNSGNPQGAAASAAQSVNQAGHQLGNTRGGGGAAGGSGASVGDSGTGSGNAESNNNFDEGGMTSSSGDPAIDQAIQNANNNSNGTVMPAMQHSLEQARQNMQNNYDYYNQQANKGRRVDITSDLTRGRPGGNDMSGTGDAAAPGYQGPLFTYADYLKMPKYTYNSTHRSELYDLLYAPQGEIASRGGLSGYDAAPNSSRFGSGPNGSLGGIQGSFGGIYPLLSEIYNALREVNPAGAMEMARILSRGGALTGIGDNGTLYFFDPDVKGAISGLLTNVNGQPGSSTGGFSNVALVLPLLFHIFDYGVEDGDNITLVVRDNTGVKFTDTFNLTNAGRDIAPSVNPGQVSITVTANNEGSLSPNTGQVDILSTVLSGNSTQQFTLLTGETGTMVITASP